MTTFLSKEPKMYEAYNNNKDLYAMIAMSAFNNNYEDNLEFYPEGTVLTIDGKEVVAGKKTHKNPDGNDRRSTGKVLNLAATYGMSGKTAGIRLGYVGDEAKQKGEALLNNFFGGFPKVKEAIEYSKDFLKKNGYVEDFIGRRRHLPDINLEPYTAELKNKGELDANFNPILGCGNRVVTNSPDKIWEEIIRRFIAYSNAYQKSKNPGFAGNNEMGNKTFERLKRIAMNPKAEKGKVWDERYKGTAEEKIYKSTGLAIPEEPVILHANTGRIAQAERQCFNARIQGCLDSESIICTRSGLHKIGDLANTEIEVFDGKAWSKAIVLPSGKKQKCILTTGTGNKIVCSPDHKFFVIETSGKASFKKLKDLKKQDRLVYSPEAPNFSNSITLKSISQINYTAIHNKHNYSFDDIPNKYICGQLLGRIASDGSYTSRDDGGNTIYFCVAEHELQLLNFIKDNIPWKYSIDYQQKKHQKVYRVKIYSSSLVEECKFLDIKHDIHSYLLQDSELLRGFISGFFDGDGCSKKSNQNINLVFGRQADFTAITTKMSLALSMFGIRNAVHKYKDRTRIDIRRADSKLFVDRIGFINHSKQADAELKETVLDGHTWKENKVSTIKSIEITNDFIDMYDVCNTERGYFVVNGLITHNSAASLTKMAMIDIHNDERLKALDTHLIIPVHDELLVECPAFYADQVEKILPEIMINAAKKGGDDVPQSCDPYNVSRWYADEIAATFVDELKKLETGDIKKGIAPLSHEEALQKMYKDHCEFPEQSILDVVTGKTEELIF